MEKLLYEIWNISDHGETVFKNLTKIISQVMDGPGRPHRMPGGRGLRYPDFGSLLEMQLYKFLEFCSWLFRSLMKSPKLSFQAFLDLVVFGHCEEQQMRGQQEKRVCCRFWGGAQILHLHLIKRQNPDFSWREWSWQAELEGEDVVQEVSQRWYG